MEKTPVPRKGKDRRRPWLSSGMWVLVTFGIITAVYWYFNREPGAIQLKYGELVEILRADDPGLSFQDVRVGKTEIRGKIVTHDPVAGADGATQVQTKEFRTSRIGFERDQELPQLLRARLGPAYQGEEEESAFKGFTSTLGTLLFFLVIIVAGFL